MKKSLILLSLIAGLFSGNVNANGDIFEAVCNGDIDAIRSFTGRIDEQKKEIKPLEWNSLSHSEVWMGGEIYNLPEKKYNYTPLMYACRGMRPDDIPTQFIDVGKNAAQSLEDETVNVIDALLDKGADPNLRDNMERNPLFIAVERLQGITVFEHLVRGGADINAKDFMGRTPLHYATLVPSRIIHDGNDVWHYGVFALRQTGKLNIDAQDSRGLTPLHYAVIGREDEDKNRKDLSNIRYSGLNSEGDFYGESVGYLPRWFNGRYPYPILTYSDTTYTDSLGHEFDLQFRSARETAEICAKTLLHHGANPNIPDNDGNAPLHIACKAGNYKMVEILLNYGNANINLENGNGRTPLQIAQDARKNASKECKKNYDNIIDRLRSEKFKETWDKVIKFFTSK